VNRLRVAVIVTRAEAGAGGVALRGVSVLDPERYDVRFYAAQGGPGLEQAKARGVCVVPLAAMGPALSPVQDRRAYLELRQHLASWRPDVVHTHSAKAGALGRLAASSLGVPAVVHTLHGFPFHEFQSWPRRRAYIAAERRLGRLTHCTLAVGTAVAAQAVRLGLADADRLRAVGVTVDSDIPARTSASRAAARRLLGIPPGARVVGTVGRLDYQKAPEDFLAAIRLLDRADVIGVWVGDGPLLAATRRRVIREGLEGRVRLLGHRSDVPLLLPAFDLFAMTSRYEGLPCAVVEAMTCGVPVVATAVNAVPDVVVPGVTGLLVPPQRPHEMAAALSSLLADRDKAARLAATAQRALGDRFSLSELGRVLDETYTECLGSHAHRRRPAALVPAGRLA